MLRSVSATIAQMGWTSEQWQALLFGTAINAAQLFLTLTKKMNVVPSEQEPLAAHFGSLSPEWRLLTCLMEEKNSHILLLPGLMGEDSGLSLEFQEERAELRELALLRCTRLSKLIQGTSTALAAAHILISNQPSIPFGFFGGAHSRALKAACKGTQLEPYRRALEKCSEPYAENFVRFQWSMSTISMGLGAASWMSGDSIEWVILALLFLATSLLGVFPMTFQWMFNKWTARLTRNLERIYRISIKGDAPLNRSRCVISNGDPLKEAANRRESVEQIQKRKLAALITPARIKNLARLNSIDESTLLEELTRVPLKSPNNQNQNRRRATRL